MILYDFRCPIDDLAIEIEDTPLAYGNQNQNVQVGKHLHAKINQDFTCPNGHVWNLGGDLLLSREA